MKLLKNQKGLAGIIELVLIALVAGTVTFVAYRAWTQNQAPKADTATQTKQEEKDTAPEGFKKYSNNDLGFSFAYPEEWGEVKVEQETPLNCISSGKGYYITFASNKLSKGTIRSKDFSHSPECGRGGAVFDSPVTYDKNYIKEAAWNADQEYSVATILRNDQHMIVAECSGFMSFVGIEALVKIGGTTYDAAKFYYHAREGGEGGVSLAGCETPLAIVSSLQDTYVKFIKTIKGI